MVKNSKNNFLKSIKLKNFLSYGGKGTEIKLKPLNVFIGPNASGKSNLIEALRILQATPQKSTTKDMSSIMSRGKEKVSEWIWKGEINKASAEINVVTGGSKQLKIPLNYILKFGSTPSGEFELIKEHIVRMKTKNTELLQHHADYIYDKGHKPILTSWLREEKAKGLKPDQIPDYAKVEDLDLNKSILAQRDDPERFPNINYLSDFFGKIKIYRYFNVGLNSPLRIPQSSSAYRGFLDEDASNLARVLSKLKLDANVNWFLDKNIEKFYPAFVEYLIDSEHGAFIYVHEEGLSKAIPATRLSDGFLRYLCLLAVLCDPEPPPVVCIEEPELCMHPDIIPTIAELLVEASTKTQLFVTTHSDTLVTALSEYPESVIICERDEEGSHLKRLNKKKLDKWLSVFGTLGALWRAGELGGNP